MKAVGGTIRTSPWPRIALGVKALKTIVQEEDQPMPLPEPSLRVAQRLERGLHVLLAAVARRRARCEPTDEVRAPIGNEEGARQIVRVFHLEKIPGTWLQPLVPANHPGHDLGAISYRKHPGRPAEESFHAAGIFRKLVRGRLRRRINLVDHAEAVEHSIELRGRVRAHPTRHQTARHTENHQSRQYSKSLHGRYATHVVNRQALRFQEAAWSGLEA